MDLLKFLNEIDIPTNTCEYWDIRIESTTKTEIKYEEYELVACQKKPSLGAFIRVYEQGMWFYASTTELGNLSKQVVDLAREARLTNLTNEGELRPYNQVSSQDRLLKCEENRLDKVLMSDKKNVCESYFEILRKYENLKSVVVKYSDEYKVKHFLSSTGVEYSFDFNHCGLAIIYSVMDQGERFDDKINIYGAKLADLKNLHKRIEDNIQESHLFASAPAIKAGDYPVVMDSEVVGVFAHESFGHKSEADFMLGDEEAKLTWKIGKRVGNECLSIVDYGAEIGTSGYCPIDDEGFKTQKTYLIKNGLLTGRLHSQLTARVLDEAPTGNGRAMNFEFEPIVRMTNTYVEPGDLSFEELISKVKLGLYAKDINHGSGLSTFTIAPRKCYMIREGKIAEPVRVSVMSGSVFEALNSIEGCSKGLQMFNSAFGGCGKMEQWPLPVGFGGSKVLVSKLVVS